MSIWSQPWGGHTARPGIRFAALIAILGLAVSACASSHSNTTSLSGGGDPQAVAAANERLAPHLKAASGAWVDTPLARKPDAGKLLYSIRYNIAEAATLDKPFEQAATALGWSVKTLAVDASDPQAQANAMTQAVTAGADFIAVSSGSAESMGPGLSAAKAADIPVFLGAGTTDPGGRANDIYGNVNVNFLGAAALSLLDETIVDSGGDAGVLILSTPDYPIVASAAETAKNEFAKNCPDCSLSVEGISPQDMAAAAAPNIAVAAIRKNPEIKYVVTLINGLATGLPQALKAAGLDQVKVMVTNPDESQVMGIASGEFAAGAMYPVSGLPWGSVDQMARYSLGMDTEQDSHALIPYPVWTSDNLPSGVTKYEGPEGFENGFLKLWDVG